MYNEINEVLLRRRNKVKFPSSIVPLPFCTDDSRRQTATIMKNIQAYGFTFDRSLFDAVMVLDDDDRKEFYFDLVNKLKKLVGADKVYKPFYPNFPQQVIEASEFELFFNAMVHYWSYGKIVPSYEAKERFPLIDDVKLKVLSLGTYEDLVEIFKNLLGSKTSLSEQDKADVSEFISTHYNFYEVLPEEIPLKENVALLGKMILDNAAFKKADKIQRYYKTATDVLRLITCLSDGDISLAEKTHYRSLRRCERRMIMDLLAGCGNILEDMYRYQYEWIRVGEIVHPSEYKQLKYKGVVEAFQKIRNDKKPLFVPGLVQQAIRNKDMLGAAEMLKSRPGDFARQLDKLLREANNKDKNYIVNCFANVAKEVSTPVLLQVRQHFADRYKEDNYRVFFPKGKLSNVVSVRNDLSPINTNVCDSIVKICNNALISQFKSKEYLGKVFIDYDFKDFLVPFSQRSASTSGKHLVRGSRVHIKGNTNVARAYCWWTNIPGGGWANRVDLDLSAAIYDEHWNFVEHVSYTRLRSSDLLAIHSGDRTDGGSPDGQGVAEFIDINIDRIAKRGRYVAFQVYSYTGQHFNQMPNSTFGWMEREDMNSGEIFEPSTVEMNIDLNSDSKVCIPVVFDCVDRSFVWCDIAMPIAQTRTHYFGNNIESNLKGVTAVCYAMTHLRKPNLYDLVKLNVAARGEIVAKREDADVIFSLDTTPVTEKVEVVNPKTKEIEVVEKVKDVKIYTPFDVDYYMGEML